MPELRDESIDWQGIQKAANKLAERLHEDRIFYFLYGLLDGEQLFVSEARAIREQLPLISSITPPEDWEYSFEGYAITIIGATFLGIMSALGCYCKDDDEGFFGWIASSWSYIRDVLKALIKWSYKAVRNILSIALQFGLSKELYLRILFPISIALGVTSSLNRIWIRMMKTERKAAMKSNKELYDEILTKGCIFHIEPDFLKIKDKSLFAASFVFVKNSNNKNKQASALYYVDKKCVDDNGKKIPPKYTEISMDDYVQFEKNFQLMLLSNLREQMQHTLKKSMESGDACTDRLFFMPKWPLDKGQNVSEEAYYELHQPCFNAYVFLTGTKKTDTPTLVYIDKDGKSCQTSYVLRSKFQQNLIETIGDKNLIGLTPDQVRTLIPKANEYQLGLTYQEWSAYRKEIIGNLDELTMFDGNVVSTSRIKRQLYTLPLRCYFAAFYAGFSDSLYFYYGSMFLTYLIPSLFIGMLAASIFYTVVYIGTCLYQEMSYQLKLEITETEDKFALCEKALEKLVLELNDITVRISTCVNDEERAILNTKQEALKEMLESEVKRQYIPLRKLLYKQTVSSRDVVIADGFRNGLGIQGVIASLMFVTAAVLPILSMSCSPMLVISATLAGLTGLFLSVSFSLKQHQNYLDTLKKRKKIDPLRQLDAFLSSIKMEKDNVREQCVYAARTITWGDKIESSPPSLLLEICEELRYTLTGGLKTGKMVTEFAHIDMEHVNLNEPNGIAIATTLAVSGILGSSIFGTRQFSKGRNLAQNDELKKPIVSCEKTTILQPPISTVLSNISSDQALSTPSIYSKNHGLFYPPDNKNTKKKSSEGGNFAHYFHIKNNPLMSASASNLSENSLLVGANPLMFC